MIYIFLFLFFNIQIKGILIFLQYFNSFVLVFIQNKKKLYTPLGCLQPKWLHDSMILQQVL